MFTNKDQIAHYMISGHVHLSKKDYGFFNNAVSQVHAGKQITSNQNSLFDKLLYKYKRQLTKLNHDVEVLKQLEWKLGVVESKKEFLEAKIYLTDNNVIIRSPFNSQFVQNFRRIDNNPFEWNSQNKRYEAPISTYSLKLAYVNVNKYYKDVVYCDNIKKVLDQIQDYSSVKFWNPTLVKINNNFYILSCNQNLANAISHIELSDDPKTLLDLSLYGIDFDTSVIDNDPVKKFASSRNLLFDLENLDYVIQMLKLLEVEHVFTSRDILYNKSISNEVKHKLLVEGITYSPQGSTNHENSVLFTTNSSGWTFKKVMKTIQLSNSRPIQIR